ncbi:MAG TPA: MFS transporter [Puia sp.]|nr:MFS transporter [Puia sp.]
MNKQTERVGGYHWILFAICFFGTAFGGTVSTLVSVYLPVAVKDLLGNKSAEDLNTISAYINSIFVFGGALGGFTWGIIGDKAGRKKAVILSIACYALFTIFTGYAPSWPGVVLCRFIAGFGMGGVLVTTTTIMIEEWPPSTRAIFMGFLSISIPIGIVSAGAINYFVSYWRQGFLIGVIPLAISIVSVWLLKESQTWEKSREKIEKKEELAVTIFSPQYRYHLLIGSLIFGAMLIGLWAIFSWVPTWVQSITNAADAQKERSISMMIFGMGGLTGGFLSGWLLNAIGSRKSMLLCYSACALCSLLLFRTNSVFTPVIYPELSGLALFFGASQGVLSVYIPQLFPTAIRATATGFCFNTGRVFTATAVLFVGVLETWLGGYGNALFIFSLVFLIGLTVTFFSRGAAEISPDNA